MQMESGVTTETIEGEIIAVFKADLTWSAGLLLTSAVDPSSTLRVTEKIRFAGALYARKGEQVAMTGMWVDDANYGRQFKVAQAAYVLPKDEVGLTRYLANCGAMAGLGLVRAGTLAKEYGADLDEALRGDLALVATRTKIPLPVIENLAKEWISRTSLNDAAVYLSQYDLSGRQVETLLAMFGATIAVVLRDEPYRILGFISGYGFKKLDEIALAMGHSPTAPMRVERGVVQVLLDDEMSGHCWTDYGLVVSRAQRLLSFTAPADVNLIRDAISHLSRDADSEKAVRDGELVCVPAGGRVRVGRRALWQAEKLISQIAIQEAKKPQPRVGVLTEEESRALARDLAPQLNAKQTDAVANALRYRFTVITGAAGVGKTFCLTTIADSYEGKGHLARLLAPTGKAAKRIHEVTKRTAQTVHKALEYNGVAFMGDTLAGAVVIVDEGSMLDAILFAELLKRIDFETTSLLLVGDDHQLPSVGAGAVLRDLVATGVVPVIELDEVVRQAGVLKANSTAILSGKMEPTQFTGPGELGDWYVLDWLGHPMEALAMVTSIFETHLEAMGVSFDDVQLLTPKHGGILGTKSMNAHLQRILQRKRFDVVVPPIPLQEGVRLRLLAGDKVIQTRNDYDIDVMNGAIGRVIWSGEPDARVVLAEFDGAKVAYTSHGSGLTKQALASIPNDMMQQINQAKADRGAFGELQDIELAYALTVHKYQGSEVKVVIAIIHQEAAFMLHRGLIYTAATRARRTAMFVGDRASIEKAVTNDVSDERRTWLGPMLRGEL